MVAVNIVCEPSGLIRFPQPSCKDCGGTVLEYDTAAGNGVCVNCGMVIEENAIVSEITFGETSSGGAMVQGSFVGQGASEVQFISLHQLSDVSVPQRMPG